MKTTSRFAATVLVVCTAVPGFAQTKSPTAPAAKVPPTAAGGSVATPPADYVIGAGDVLAINYRDEKEMTGDYLVRPDGKITLPLIDDINVLGLTPDQLKERLNQASAKYFVNPTITVGAKVINSRKVFITGGVAKPAPYDLLIPMTVSQLISVAGGLREFVSGKNITIIRKEGGKSSSFKFNYKEVLEGKNLGQDIPLKPGDTVLVPE